MWPQRQVCASVAALAMGLTCDGMQSRTFHTVCLHICSAMMESLCRKRVTHKSSREVLVRKQFASSSTAAPNTLLSMHSSSLPSTGLDA